MIPLSLIGLAATMPSAGAKLPEVSLTELSTAVDGLVRRLDTLEPKAQPELFRRHLRSVRALVRAEEGRAYAGLPNETVARTLGFVRDLQRGFNADAADWQTYLDGRRSLLLTYVSRRDNSLAHYSLTLPRDWRTEQAYPLYLELHGAGDPHPLGWPTGQLGLPDRVKAADYKRPTMVPMVERKGFHVYPYGRGNSGYADIGETDVWEALADAERSVRLDPERYYLYGFSMGGGGTWRLGARTPDKWAAMAMLAPAATSIATEAKYGLGRNVANVPTWIFCGDKDFLIPFARGLRDEIGRFGPKPVYTEVPGLEHNFTQESQTLAMRFFDGKVRKRPTKFAYVADTAQHLGAWGVRLVRDLSVSGTPSFEVEVTGQTVRLSSVGTPGLALDLPAMGLSGEAVVIWNGKEAYRGNAKAITVGDFPEERRR
jgi:predicted esterase